MSASAAGAATTIREIERKLRVHGLFRLPDLRALPEIGSVTAQSPRDLTAVYHDTADLRLIRWGVTLRRREGGPDAGWHVKLPVAGADGSVRDEVQLPLDAGAVGSVPTEFAELLTAFAREEPLVPVATVRNHRIPHLLSDQDGNHRLELVDDSVSILDGKRVVARFRELEVEAITDGDETAAMLDAVSDRLQQVGGVPSQESKASAALGPVAAEPPDVVRQPDACPDDPARTAILALLSKHVRRLLLQDVRVRRDLPDSVHQMRVAARRLRSGLKAFGPLLDPQWAGELRDDLGWVARQLGGMRDTEVMSARLTERASLLPPDEADLASSAISGALTATFDHARQDALIALTSDRHRDLLRRLVDAATDPPFTPAAEVSCARALPPLVEKTWSKLDREVKTLDINGAAHPWHDARIRAKKARYSAEALVPVFGTEVKPLVKALESVTELLGDHQDAHVAQQTLRSIAANVDGPSGFSLGLLHGLEVDHEMELRSQFQDRWPTVRRIHRLTDLTGRRT